MLPPYFRPCTRPGNDGEFSHTEWLPGMRLRHFSPTCSAHIENCEGWWLSGCHSSVAEHWLHKPCSVLGSIPGAYWPFHLSLFFTSKHLNSLCDLDIKHVCRWKKYNNPCSCEFSFSAITNYRHWIHYDGCITGKSYAKFGCSILILKLLILGT